MYDRDETTYTSISAALCGRQTREYDNDVDERLLRVKIETKDAGVWSWQSRDKRSEKSAKFYPTAQSAKGAKSREDIKI